MYGNACSVTAGPTGDDLDTSGAEISDERLIVEDMFIACTTAAGALPWAPESTVDVTAQVGRSGSPADCAALARRMEDCFDGDERYLSAEASVTKPEPEKLSFALSAETDTGTFELVLEQENGEPMRVVKLG